MPFSAHAVYICEKPACLANQERKQLQEKSIIALKKLRQMQAQKTKFTSNIMSARWNVQKSTEDLCNIGDSDDNKP